MVLDAEAEIEIQLIAELKFAPEFLVALMGGHVGLAPDMRKVGEFHGWSFAADLESNAILVEIQQPQ
jgi:hypothetical protein